MILGFGKLLRQSSLIFLQLLVSCFRGDINERRNIKGSFRVRIQCDADVEKVPFFVLNLDFLISAPGGVADSSMEEFLDEGKLLALFNQFDTDGSGIITTENIVTAMNKIGHQIT